MGGWSSKPKPRVTIQTDPEPTIRSSRSDTIVIPFVVEDTAATVLVDRTGDNVDIIEHANID